MPSLLWPTSARCLCLWLLLSMPCAAKPLTSARPTDQASLAANTKASIIIQLTQDMTEGAQTDEDWGRNRILLAQKLLLDSELRIAAETAMIGAPGTMDRLTDPESWSEIFDEVLIWPMERDQHRPWNIRWQPGRHAPELLLLGPTLGEIRAADWDESPWPVPYKLATGLSLANSDSADGPRQNPDLAYWASLASGIVRTIQIAALVEGKRPDSVEAAFETLNVAIVSSNYGPMTFEFEGLRLYRSMTDDSFGLLLDTPEKRVWIYSDPKILGQGWGVWIRGLDLQRDAERIDQELAGMEFWAELKECSLLHAFLPPKQGVAPMWTAPAVEDDSG